MVWGCVLWGGWPQFSSPSPKESVGEVEHSKVAKWGGWDMADQAWVGIGLEALAQFCWYMSELNIVAAETYHGAREQMSPSAEETFSR